MLIKTLSLDKGIHLIPELNPQIKGLLALRRPARDAEKATGPLSATLAEPWRRASAPVYANRLKAEPSRVSFSGVPQSLGAKASSRAPPPAAPSPLSRASPHRSHRGAFQGCCSGEQLLFCGPSAAAVPGANFTVLTGSKLGNTEQAVAGSLPSPSGQCPLRLVSRRSFHPTPSESGPGCSAPGTSPSHCCRPRSC